MATELQKAFLFLVRLGIGNDNHIRIDSRNALKNINWDALQSLANEQGLSAVVVDGVDKLPMELRPPKPVLLQWIGETLQGFEYRYELYLRTIAEMAAFYDEHGYKMMVLKGYACSLDWPRPEHRPCGDIDIWQFGQWKEADESLSREKVIKIDNSHHHHTVFNWQGFSVENHYDFVNVHHSKSNAEIEKEFKRLGMDDSHYVELNGEKVYLPSPNLHALFLLRHAMIEFAASGINLRHLLDWAFFVKAHGREIDWEWLENRLEEYGMKRLYDVFNAICVRDFGFDVMLFPRVQFDPYLKDRVLKEILNPAIPNEEPQQLLPRVVWKWRRWKANEWKHELCYKESMWSAFWSGGWNHLLKPASI